MSAAERAPSASPPTFRSAAAVDVCDPRVTEGDEVVDGDLGSKPLVSSHAVDVLRPGGSRDQDDRDHLSGLVDRRHVQQRSGKDEPVRLKLEQRFERDRLAFGNPDAGIEERPITPLKRLGLDPRDHIGEEGVVEIRQHHAEHVRSLLHQAASHRVRAVSELLNSLENGGAPLVAHIRRFLHHQRDERLRDAGSLCYIVDGWSAHQSYAPITRWS